MWNSKQMTLFIPSKCMFVVVFQETFLVLDHSMALRGFPFYFEIYFMSSTNNSAIPVKNKRNIAVYITVELVVM